MTLTKTRWRASKYVCNTKSLCCFELALEQLSYNWQEEQKSTTRHIRIIHNKTRCKLPYFITLLHFQSEIYIPPKVLYGTLFQLTGKAKNTFILLSESFVISKQIKFVSHITKSIDQLYFSADCKDSSVIVIFLKDLDRIR